MRRKVRVTFPKYVYEVLQKDKEYLDLKYETLYNLIVEGLGFKQIYELGLEVVDEKKSILFTLNDKNTKLFLEMLKNSSVDEEKILLKNIFITYANLHPSIRQRILYNNLFLQIDQAIYKRKKIKIYYKSKIYELSNIALSRDLDTGYSFLKGKINNQEYQFEVKFIEYIIL